MQRLWSKQRLSGRQCPSGSRRLSGRVLIAGGIAGAIILSSGALAGCSGSGGSSSGSAAESSAAIGGPAGVPAAANAAAPNGAQGASGSAAPGAASGAGSGAGGSGSSAPSGSGQRASAAKLIATAQSIIYTAQLTVRAPSVSSALARAVQIVQAVGGYVASENATSDPDHPSSATATAAFKIPVADYQSTLASLSSGSVGTQLSLQQQAQDVTQQVADVTSQVASDEAAITQLRQLLKNAGSVGDLLQVQDQINSEESDLESMQAQQRALDHEVSYATVTVTIVGPKAPVKAATRAKTVPPPGLVSGARGGWHAFKLTLDWILAIGGAVAPFAAALALLAAIALWARRRLRHPAPATAAEPQDDLRQVGY